MRLKVHTQILIAIVLGAVAGLALGEKAVHLKFAGDMFIQLLKMIIIPLILASMVAGIVSLGDIRRLGRIGLKTFIYYTATTLLAVSVGLVLVNLMKPGVGVKMGVEAAVDMADRETPSIISIIEDIIPENVFAAMAENKVLSVIFFSLLLGIAISNTGEKARPLTAFFESLNTVMMKITEWIMLLAPLGVFALMAYTIGTMGFSVLRPLAVYMVTVVLGLSIHAFVTLPVLLSLFGKYSPLKFIRDMFSAVATAFSTASSAATLPITMECLRKNTGVSNKVASFVLPLGATVNMDGTALYEAVAAMFIAQAYGINLSIGQQLVIMLTATLASIGAAAIPGAGLVTMVIVLKAVNLPLEGIGMILAVDRILDMLRTAVNVWGDACGTAVVARLEGEELNHTALNNQTGKN
ncbi:MAG: dicarboxylate/amino acid:cation symporter [Sedimentisphaerales bacterium]